MGFVLLILGLGSIAAICAGWLWIIVAAIQAGDTLWGVACVLFSPLVLVYGILNFQELKTPLSLIGGGVLGSFVATVLASFIG